MKLNVTTTGLNYVRYSSLLERSFDEAVAEPGFRAGIVALIDRLTLRGKGVIIYGAGLFGRYVRNILLDQGIESVRFLDRFGNREVDGVPVEQAKGATVSGTVIVAISPEHFYSVLQTVNTMLCRETTLAFLWNVPTLSTEKCMEVELNSILPVLPGYMGYQVLQSISAKKPYLELYPEEGSLQAINELVIPYLPDNPSIVEIGAGTGKNSIFICDNIQHGQYHVFETESYWQDHIVELFKRWPNMSLTTHPCDGHSLDSLDDNSAEMVFASGVFCYLPTITALNYVMEASRVLRPEGRLVFDFHDADDMDSFLHFSASQQEQGHFFRNALSTQLITRALAPQGMVPSKEQVGEFKVWFKR